MVSHKNHRGRKKTDHDLEKLYNEIFKSLVFDITPEGSRLREFGLSKICDRRTVCPTGYHGIGDPAAFKRWYQIDTFHKRLIFGDDIPEEKLTEECLKDFSEFQSKSLFIQPSARPFCKKVKALVGEILGEFDLHEFSLWCGFGKKAARNLPRAKSYIDVRVEHLNGTEDQLALFNYVRSEDIHLLRATRKGIKTFERVNTVQIETVPKSHKAVRVIGLDSTVGGFLSKGLGNYIRHRVEAGTPINLAIQQDRHKQWAAKGSADGQSATIDMSKASDSFTMQHLVEFLPESWQEVLRIVRMDAWSHGATQTGGTLSSLMLMGSGHTFPLQTLLFWALAKVTCNELSLRGLVSVYGDDIILPNRAAEPFMAFARSLGFTVNSDKSFWSSCHCHVVKFRESCGGDYYRGFDVRPYQPECQMKKVPKTQYIAECHKLLNGLQERWHPTEIPRTVDYILECLNGVCTVSFGPNTEPETACVRISLLDWVSPTFPINVPRVKDGITTFKALRIDGRRRRNNGRAPYWDWLRRSNGMRFKGYHRPGKDSGPALSRVGSVFGSEMVRGRKIRYKWVDTPGAK